MGLFRIVLTLSLWLAFNSASFSQDGSVDHAFNAPDIGFGFGDGPNYSVEAIVCQNDGKTIIAGTFTRYNGVLRNGIARLQPDGTLDASYAPEPDGPVRCMALQADGSLIVGGDFTTINGQNCNRVARLTPNGDIDASFSVGAGPDGEVRAIAIQADQRILIKGNFLEVGGQSMMFLARLTSAGALDMTFSANAQLQLDGGGALRFNRAIRKS